MCRMTLSESQQLHLTRVRACVIIKGDGLAPNWKEYLPRISFLRMFLRIFILSGEHILEL